PQPSTTPPPYGEAVQSNGTFGAGELLAWIMHHAERFSHFRLAARAGDPSGWIGVRPLALQRVWDDLPVSAARRGTPPRSLWAGRHEAERDGAEQRPLRATRRQLDTNARDVLDHARPDLDQALSDRGELALGERVRLRNCGAHTMHQPERGGVEDEPHLIGGRAVT